MHCTLMAKARPMEIYANCPPYLWDEFYLMAAHLHSRTLTRSLEGGITPWEKYHGRKPDYSYMCKIRCCVFVLIQSKHNPKVYNHSLECVLISYDPNAKTYCCYNQESKKVISSYHVWFLESHDGHHCSPPQTETEPSSLDEILKNSMSTPIKRWEEGYRDKLKSLKDMGVYKLIPRSDIPQGHKIRKGMPVFRIKCDETGKAVRWKVCLVFKGFEQIYGKDRTKTTSPTSHMESWQILLHLTATLDWDTQQIDIKTAFLYGLLPEEEYQYMGQPPEFEEPGRGLGVGHPTRSLQYETERMHLEPDNE